MGKDTKFIELKKMSPVKRGLLPDEAVELIAERDELRNKLNISEDTLKTIQEWTNMLTGGPSADECRGYDKAKAHVKLIIKGIISTEEGGDE